MAKFNKTRNVNSSFNKFQVMTNLCRHLSTYYESTHLSFLLHKDSSIYVYHGANMVEFAKITCLRSNIGNYFVRFGLTAQTTRSRNVRIPITMF